MTVSMTGIHGDYYLTREQFSNNTIGYILMIL